MKNMACVGTIIGRPCPDMCCRFIRKKRGGVTARRNLFLLAVKSRTEFRSGFAHMPITPQWIGIFWICWRDNTWSMDQFHNTAKNWTQPLRYTRYWVLGNYPYRRVSSPWTENPQRRIPQYAVKPTGKRDIYTSHLPRTILGEKSAGVRVWYVFWPIRRKAMEHARISMKRLYPARLCWFKKQTRIYRQVRWCTYRSMKRGNL